MKIRLFFIQYVVVALAVLLMCNHKNASKEVIVIGSDTLSLEEIRILMPDASLDSVKIRNLILRICIAGDKYRTSDSTVHSFAEQMSLRSGNEWNVKGASYLLNGAYNLISKLDSTASVPLVVAWAESLFSSASKNVSLPYASCNFRVDSGVVPSIENKKLMRDFLQSMMFVNEDAAKLLVDFLLFKEKKITNASNMVKGLVFSESESVKKIKKKQPVASKKTVDNSLKALEFRSQQSIRDSIEKHILNIRSLYKKYLKIQSGLEGVALVTIRVDYLGNVIETSLKKTTISDDKFLSSLLDYIRTIRFMEIPKSAGNMTFEFPFEFYSEM